MRITIVDRQMNVVREVLDFGIAQETPYLREQLFHFEDFLAQYRSDDYRWYVTVSDKMPTHFAHDEHGRQLDT